MERLTWHFNVRAMSYTQVTPWANHVVWPVRPATFLYLSEPFGYYWKRFLFRWARQPIKCCKLSSSPVRWKNICKSHIIRAPSNRQHYADNNQTARSMEAMEPSNTHLHQIAFYLQALSWTMLSLRPLQGIAAPVLFRCVDFIPFGCINILLIGLLWLRAGIWKSVHVCCDSCLARVRQWQMLGRSVVYRKDFWTACRLVGTMGPRTHIE